MILFLLGAPGVVFAQVSNPGVTRITAGTNVTISPSGGTGNVTINASASGGGTVSSPGMTTGQYPVALGPQSIGDSTGYYASTNGTSWRAGGVSSYFYVHDAEGDYYGPIFGVEHDARVQGDLTLGTTVGMTFAHDNIGTGFYILQVPPAQGTGVIQNDGSGNLSFSLALDNGTTATTQTPGDNSTKVATTAYVASPGAIAPSTDSPANLVQGEPSYPTAAHTLTSSPAYFDCSQFSGADIGIQLQACATAAGTVNSVSTILDARGIVPSATAATVSPFNATSISTSGVLLMPAGTVYTNVPWVSHGNWSIKGVTPNAGDGTNVAIGNQVVGSTLKAGSAWKLTYATGTVTMGTAGAAEVITGSGTSWAANVVPGCAFVSPAGGNTTPITWGYVKAGSTITDTSITLQWGANQNGQPTAGATYDIYCPVFAMGDGNTANQGFDFGIGVENISFDCNNKTGCIPAQNWFAGQHSYMTDVNAYNFNTIGVDIEQTYTQNSGPYVRTASYPGTSCTANTIPIVMETTSGIFPLDSPSIFGSNGTCTTTPDVGIKLEGSGIKVIHADAEGITTGIAINGNHACTPACIFGSSYQEGAASEITVDGLHGAGTNGVTLTNTNGAPKGIKILDVTGFTNVLVDSPNSCTYPWVGDYGLGLYVTDAAGAIAFSTSSVAACRSANAFTNMGAITWNNAGTCTFAANGALFSFGTLATTSGQSCTLSPTNLKTGGSYTLKITNAASTAATLTLGTGGSCSAWKVGGGGSGAVTLSGSSDIDMLAFTFDGTNCIANFKGNFN